jgi:hypothetical protein
MAVPGRVDAAALLLSLDPPPWFLRHSRAVAEVAGWLALRTETAGREVDRAVAEAAALLHDVDKLAPVAALVTPVAAVVAPQHGDGSAAWLAARGLGSLSSAVSTHPVTRLADGAWFEWWIASASAEDLIVAYADKRAGQRLESMDRRFGSWARRYPSDAGTPAWDAATIASIRGRAERLERDVCRLAGVRAGDVRRLAWTDRAFRGARSRVDGRTAA